MLGEQFEIQRTSLMIIGTLELKTHSVNYALGIKLNTGELSTSLG
jgi:hypothetical protein